MELILAEKPKAAEKIASALSDGNFSKIEKRKAYWFKCNVNGKKLIVAPSVGHLFALQPKEKSYPIFDVKWIQNFKKDRSARYQEKYYRNLKELSSKANEFTIATDYDLEGDVIGWLIMQQIFKRNAARMKFSTLTAKELRSSWKRKNRLDMNQVNAGLARHRLDFYWGVNSSRALIRSLKKAGRYKTLSIGRVQGPALQILATREKEINEFTPKTYWICKALLKGNKDKIEAFRKPTRIKTKKKADQIKEKCSGKTAKVSKLKENEFDLNPFPPFNLGDLQSEAYKIFRFFPSKTLRLAQSLYESGLISYPRTSSQKLPAQIGYRDILKKLGNQQRYKQFTRKILQKKELRPIQGKKKDPAHPAIYPTGEKPKKISYKEEKLYDLIVKRFLACFAKSAKRKNLLIQIELAGEKFIAKGEWTIEKNWMLFYKPFIRIKENPIPLYNTNDKLKVLSIKLLEKKTKPPRRFNQSSLIKELEKRSLGTKATRCEIIRKLYTRGYIRGRKIRVTELGFAAFKILHTYVPEIISEKLTRQFEQELELIMKGRAKKKEILQKAKIKLRKIFDKFRLNEKKIGKQLAKALDKFRKRERVLGDCRCGRKLQIIKKEKQFVGCTGYPDCKNSYPLPQKAKVIASNKKCKECGLPTITIIKKGKRPFQMCIDPDCKSKKK